MEFYGIGNALHFYRELNELSQTQVCEGICSLATLSRIELGERKYDSLISETLFSRLGKTVNRFEFVLNQEDYLLSDIRYQIKNLLEKGELSGAGELLEKYYGMMPKKDKLHQQFYLFHKAMLLKLKGEEKEKEKVTDFLYQAITLTRSDFMEKGEKLYSSIEVEIIYELFVYERYEESQLQPLLQFMENYYDTEKKEKNLIPFYLIFMEKYEIEKRYREIVDLSERAIKIICSGRSYRNLADFYFRKLQSEEALFSGTDQWNDKREENIRMCNNLYYMYMIEEREDKMEQMKQFCEERFHGKIKE